MALARMLLLPFVFSFAGAVVALFGNGGHLLFFLLTLDLLLPQLGKDAFLLNQFVKSASLCHLAFVDDEQLLCTSDGAQSLYDGSVSSLDPRTTPHTCEQ